MFATLNLCISIASAASVQSMYLDKGSCYAKTTVVTMKNTCFLSNDVTKAQTNTYRVEVATAIGWHLLHNRLPGSGVLAVAAEIYECMYIRVHNVHTSM